MQLRLTVCQRILQRLRSIRAQYDPIVRVQPSPLRLITLHTLDVPLVQIPSQIADLLVHEAYNRAWTLFVNCSSLTPIDRRRRFMAGRQAGRQLLTVLQQIIPLLLTSGAIDRLVAVIAPLSVLALSFWCQAAGDVAEGVAPAYPGVISDGVCCVVGIGR